MQRARRLRWRIAGVIVAALMLGLAATAMAGPEEVILDFNDDGFIQGDYPVGDLRNAPLLMQVLNPAQVGNLLRVANEKIAEKTLGIKPPLAATGPAESPPVGDLPMWFLAAAIGAGLLALSGAGSAIYRRVRQ